MIRYRHLNMMHTYMTNLAYNMNIDRIVRTILTI